MPDYFRAHFRVQGIKINKPGFTEAFEREAMIQVRQGARAFLANMILRIPVWTGFTRGSIKFAQGTNGDLYKYLRVAIPITGTKPLPKWYYPNRGGRRVEKIPANAGRFGQYSFTSGGHRFGFSIRLDTVQFLINEFYAVPTNHYVPWNSLDAGRTAFYTYMANFGRKRLPRVRDWTIKTLPVTFG